MVELRTDGDIVVEGETVGRLIYDKNHLEKIEIEYQHQGNGFGTAAIKEFVERAHENGYTEATTTPATSKAVKHIFDKLGFDRVEDPSKHDFLDAGPSERYLACYLKDLDCSSEDLFED